MEWTLELVVMPVSDVDQAEDFYVNKVGFGVDVDTTPAPGFFGLPPTLPAD